MPIYIDLYQLLGILVKRLTNGVTMKKYNGYKYSVNPIEVEMATPYRQEHPRTKIGYVFIIHDVYFDYHNNSPDYESEEWFDTEREAVSAAENTIDSLECDGEPDYDEEPYGAIDWDERRKLGE